MSNDELRDVEPLTWEVRGEDRKSIGCVRNCRLHFAPAGGTVSIVHPGLT